MTVSAFCFIVLVITTAENIADATRVAFSSSVRSSVILVTIVSFVLMIVFSVTVAFTSVSIWALTVEFVVSVV